MHSQSPQSPPRGQAGILQRLSPQQQSMPFSTPRSGASSVGGFGYLSGRKAKVLPPPSPSADVATTGAMSPRMAAMSPRSWSASVPTAARPPQPSAAVSRTKIEQSAVLTRATSGPIGGFVDATKKKDATGPIRVNRPVAPFELQAQNIAVCRDTMNAFDVLTVHCESQFKAAFSSINVLSASCEERFRAFEERLQKMHDTVTRELPSTSRSSEALVEQHLKDIEERLQEISSVRPSLPASSPENRIEGTEQSGQNRVEEEVLKLSVQLQAMNEEVVKLSIQLQGERGARQQLSAHIAAQVAQLEAHVSPRTPNERYDIEKLKAELQLEAQELRCRNAEMIAQSTNELAEARQQFAQDAAARIEKLEADIRFRIPIADRDRSTADIEKLMADLDHEVRERCYKDAEIIARNARELAEIRKWSISELGRLQAQWEVTESTRHHLQQKDLVETCSRMQANIDSLSEVIFR